MLAAPEDDRRGPQSIDGPPLRGLDLSEHLVETHVGAGADPHRVLSEVIAVPGRARLATGALPFLEDDDVEAARERELVGDGQARDPASDDDDLGPVG